MLKKKGVVVRRSSIQKCNVVYSGIGFVQSLAFICGVMNCRRLG